MCVQHIKEQYEALKPILDALVAAYPQHLQAAWFSWEAYLWAVQLWYAYAMQVSQSDNAFGHMHKPLHISCRVLRILCMCTGWLYVRSLCCVCA